MSHWCKIMQFCRFFSGGYAVTVAGDLSVALFWQLEEVVAQGEISLPWLLTPGRALHVSDRVVSVCLP